MDDQLILFELDPADVLPPQIAHMRLVHGADNAHRCGTCFNFRPAVTEKNIHAKCYQYGISASAATDWRKKWPACGLWQEREE